MSINQSNGLHRYDRASGDYKSSSKCRCGRCAWCDSFQPNTITFSQPNKKRLTWTGKPLPQSESSRLVTPAFRHCSGPVQKEFDHVAFIRCAGKPPDWDEMSIGFAAEHFIRRRHHFARIQIMIHEGDVVDSDAGNIGIRIIDWLRLNVRLIDEIDTRSSPELRRNCRQRCVYRS